MNDQTSQHFPNITSAIAYLEGAGYTPTVQPTLDLTEWSMRPRSGTPVQARLHCHGGGATVIFQQMSECITYGHAWFMNAQRGFVIDECKDCGATREPL